MESYFYSGDPDCERLAFNAFQGEQFIRQEDLEELEAEADLSDWCDECESDSGTGIWDWEQSWEQSDDCDSEDGEDGEDDFDDEDEEDDED